MVGGSWMGDGARHRFVGEGVGCRMVVGVGGSLVVVVGVGVGVGGDGSGGGGGGGVDGRVEARREAGGGCCQQQCVLRRQGRREGVGEVGGRLGRHGEVVGRGDDGGDCCGDSLEWLFFFGGWVYGGDFVCIETVLLLWRIESNRCFVSHWFWSRSRIVGFACRWFGSREFGDDGERF